MRSARAGPRGGWPEVGAALIFLEQTFAVAEADVRKLRHDPIILATRAVQPALWLLVFGQVLAQVRVVPTGGIGYLDFMAPGILAQSSLFIAIFFGISVIWERDLGILHKFLVSPASRVALVLGKAAAAGVRGVVQAFIVYVLALILGVHVRANPLAVVGVVLVVMLGSALFATFSLMMACLVRDRERLMGFGQVLTMPLFFASNAIYPIAMMPVWLQVVSHVNPLTYQIDALRALMIEGAASGFGVGFDVGVQLAIFALLVAVASRLYPRMV
jgi:ABC-2 type transport system permease protein